MEIIEIRPFGSSSSSSGRAFQVSELRRQSKPLKRFKHLAVRALAETNACLFPLDYIMVSLPRFLWKEAYLNRIHKLIIVSAVPQRIS
jgi:hypothetical protein